MTERSSNSGAKMPRIWAINEAGGNTLSKRTPFKKIFEFNILVLVLNIFRGDCKMLFQSAEANSRFHVPVLNIEQISL